MKLTINEQFQVAIAALRMIYLDNLSPRTAWYYAKSGGCSILVYNIAREEVNAKRAEARRMRHRSKAKKLAARRHDR